MGNNLCKERIHRAHNSKSPIDRVLGRCVQIWPGAFGHKHSNYCRKHQFYSNPANLAMGKCNNIQKPIPVIAMQNMDKDPNIPIAPPRKKRNTLRRDKTPGGFSDVFGNITNDASSEINLKCSTLDTDNTDVNNQNIPERDTLKKICSKVGNKKSDKFFGENLSYYLSDDSNNDNFIIVRKESILPNPADKLDVFVENNIFQNNAILPNNAGGCEKRKFSNADKPIPPPLIIPKRKSRYVASSNSDCYISPYVKQNSSPNIEKLTDEKTNLPIKPIRGPPKLEVSSDDKNSKKILHSISMFNEVKNNNFFTTSSGMKPSQSAENNNNLSVNDIKTKPAISNDSNDHTIDNLNYEKVEAMLKKCSSSQSFLTQDLMNQIVNKVYGFTMNWDDQENNINSSYNDCSEMVLPQSKVATRKISVARQEREKAVKEEEEEEGKVEAPKFSIGNSTLGSDNVIQQNDFDNQINIVITEEFLKQEQKFALESCFCITEKRENSDQISQNHDVAETNDFSSLNINIDGANPSTMEPEHVLTEIVLKKDSININRDGGNISTMESEHVLTEIVSKNKEDDISEIFNNISTTTQLYEEKLSYGSNVIGSNISKKLKQDERDKNNVDKTVEITVPDQIEHLI